jgi:Flp pilus assembly protein TadB
MIISKGDIFAVSMNEVISAGVIAILPIIINWLNPHDTRYGKN